MSAANPHISSPDPPAVRNRHGPEPWALLAPHRCVHCLRSLGLTQRLLSSHPHSFGPLKVGGKASCLDHAIKRRERTLTCWGSCRFCWLSPNFSITRNLDFHWPLMSVILNYANSYQWGPISYQAFLPGWHFPQSLPLLWV